MRTQPRKMSLTACISRCPTTTRCPEFSNSLAPTNSSSTDGPASFACRNSGSTSSSPSSPSSSSIHARVPTLPTRAWAETACDRHGSARALPRPVLDGSEAALLPTSVIDARLPEALIAATAGDPFAARRALPTALAAAGPLDALRPLVQAGPDVRAVLAHHRGGFGAADDFADRALATGPRRENYTQLGVGSHRSAVLTDHEHGLLSGVH